MTETPNRSEKVRIYHLATSQAKATLKRGDRLRVTKCPGTKRWITFECWDGDWIVSKSGINDYHAITIDRVNDKAINFPIHPDPALLESMAMRYRHDFGLLDSKHQAAILVTMRQLWEEVAGVGFYRPLRH
jgi:hypothetical protein